MRRARITGGFILLVACRGVFAAGQPAVERASVPVVRLRDGSEAFSTYTGVSDSLRVVVRDSVEWRELWGRIQRPFFPKPALPPVDFRRDMIVVAALGSRPSGGYDVVIEAADQVSTGIEIAVRRASPGPGCPVAAAFTQPLDLALIPASPQPVRFREHSVVIRCGSP